MANYDVIEDKGSYLGTKIRSQLPNQAYKDNYDRIFRNKQEMDEMSEIIEAKNKDVL
jgi:hypothetical protein